MYLGRMKESYHLCFTSHDEVMFRDAEDHGMFLNILALRGFALETEVECEAEMSTHVHMNAFTAQPGRFAGQVRMSYTKWFNAKYGREGRFGEKYTFISKVEGFYHQLVVFSYILRNGLHHCAAATAFGYPYCSVREQFADDLGMAQEVAGHWSKEEMASILPRYSEFPDEYQMTAQGVFLRRSFMEIRKVEQYYATPRGYLYQMNRLTDESWSREQLQDQTGPPITLRDVEQADENTVAQLLKNESGRGFKHGRMQDLDVCHLIDHDLLPGYGVQSVYQLTATQKQRIARQLFYEFHLPEHQIRRCLVMG